MTLENQGIIQVNKSNRCYPPYPLIFVNTVIAVGSMTNLMSGVLQVLFPGRAHSFISCQLLEKDEHQVLVKGFGLSQPRKRMVRINHTTLTNFSTKHLVICKVYTDVGGIK